MYKKILVAGLFLALAGMVIGQTQMIKNIEWLQGTWASKQADSSIVYESWSFANDSTLIGGSYKVQNGDSVLQQYSRLNLGKKNFYGYTNPQKNEGNEIVLNAKTTTAADLSFENLSNDLPQTIHYVKVSEDSMYCKITGTIKGQNRDRVYGYKKVESELYGMRKLWIALVYTGPNFQANDVNASKLQMQHINAVQDWSNKGKMVSAGPIEDPASDVKELLIFSCVKETEVRKLLDSDPIFKGGRYKYSVKSWLSK